MLTCLASSSPVHAQVLEQDSLALVAINNNMGGASWTTPWNLSTPISSWDGITVSGNRVTGLNLLNNNLSGALPDSIGDLTALTTLWLGGDPITGSLPATIGNLTNVTGFYIYLTNLSGSIPPEIGGMTSLYALLLESNSLSGPIPAEIGNLTNLYTLKLYDNQLNGAIPATIANCSKLNQIYIQDNQFDGLPDLSSLSYLANLVIENNKFTFEDIEPNIGAATGSFDYSPQANVGQTENITILENTDRTISVTVGGNSNNYQWSKDGANISGATSDSYVISNAQFADEGAYTCRITNALVPGLTLTSYPFNVSLTSLATEQDSLALVDLYNSTDGPNWAEPYKSDWLSGPISGWPGLLFTAGRVTYLSLANANLTGTIPAAVGDLTELTKLNLYNNNLTGPIPAAIGNLTALIELDLSLNELSGSIPSMIGNWTSLTWLYLGGNQLSGSIPAELGNLTNMTYLWLFDNQLSGTIPAEIGDCSSLTSLYLYNNQLEGAVPYEVTFLSQLKDLHVQDNRLEDLPNLDDLSSLNYLYVENNRLTFEDIEPNIEVPNVRFTYTPQDSLGSEIDTSVADGAGLTLAVAVGGTANEYQWMKNSVDIAAATSDTLTFSAVQMADAGAYILRITNPLASACTLYTRPMHVTIVDVPPATPQSLMAVTGDRQVTLVWEPNTEGDLLRYRVYGGTSPYPMTVVDSTAATTSSVADLNNGTLYFFRITAVDQAMNESDYSAQISIVPYDRPPVAGMDSATTTEDTPVIISVLANDSDADGDVLSIVATSNGGHGSTADNGDGTVTYTPADDFNGTDNFVYTVSDDFGGEGMALVTVTVAPVQDPPTAADDYVSTGEDIPVIIPVLNNDHDVDGDTISISLVNSTPNGVAVHNGNGMVTYTPAADYSGADDFTYQITDGHSNTDTATVYVTVGGINDLPQVTADAAQTNEDVAVTFNVLANDSDVDQDNLTVNGVTQPPHGTVTIGTNGELTYLPEADFNGSDQFIYIASDASGAQGVGTVTVTILPLQDLPIAVDDRAATAEDMPVVIEVLNNDYDVDGDAVSLAGVAAPVSGQTTDNGDGTITYTPATDYNGADAFTYTISDGNGNDAVGIVIVSIGAVNDVPFAVGDTAETAEDTPVTFDVLANDSDVDEQSLLITGTTQGAHGTVAVNLDKTLTYTPVADYNGHDSFVYLVADGAGGTSVGLVQLSITPVNDAPAAFALLPQASSSITVLPDATGDTLAFAWEAAVDVDGDPVRYHFISTGNLALLGLVDTTVTEIKLAHADVWALMDGAGVATLSGTWTVEATDGEYTVKAGSDPQALTINAGALALEDLPGVPSDFALQQNYPNPFNPSTTIRFDLPEAAEVSLLVYDMLGREVARLVTGQMEAGYHSVTWDGREATGRSVPTGLYIARMVTPAYSHTIKLVLLK